MKKHIALLTGIAGLALLAFTAPAFAAHDKEVTITGSESQSIDFTFTAK